MSWSKPAVWMNKLSAYQKKNQVFFSWQSWIFFFIMIFIQFIDFDTVIVSFLLYTKPKT